MRKGLNILILPIILAGCAYGQTKDVFAEVDSLLKSEGYDLTKIYADTVGEINSFETKLENVIRDTVNYRLCHADYSAIDKYAISLGSHYRNISNLSSDLTKNYKTESEKVRSIYKWMTTYISYDYYMMNHLSQYVNSHTYTTKADWDKWVKSEDRKFAELTLRRGKSVCEGFSQLFYQLCTEAGIECLVIDGYAINKPEAKVKHVSPKAANHAWNVVSINEKWFLMDVTWSYYLLPPEEFILDHHPQADKWQLLDNPITMNEFVKNGYRNK